VLKKKNGGVKPSSSSLTKEWILFWFIELFIYEFNLCLSLIRDTVFFENI